MFSFDSTYKKLNILDVLPHFFLILLIVKYSCCVLYERFTWMAVPLFTYGQLPALLSREENWTVIPYRTIIVRMFIVPNESLISL